MIVLVCGSRNWTDGRQISEDLSELPDGAVIIHGDAPGADRLAGYYAAHMGHHVAAVPALWPYYGKSAGPRRNAAMLTLRPDVVYAYPLGASPGTRDMIRQAEAKGVRVVVCEPTTALQHLRKPGDQS